MHPSLSLALVAPAALVLTLGQAGCESKVTKANYDQVNVGMTLAQVQALLGDGREDSAGAGLSVSGAGVGEISGPRERVFVWEDDAGGKIVVTFAQDRVVQKRSEGL